MKYLRDLSVVVLGLLVYKIAFVLIAPKVVMILNVMMQIG